MRTARILIVSSLILLTFLPLIYHTGLPGLTVVHGQVSSVTLGVWSPDLQSSNITSLGLAFQPGQEFQVYVNVTGAGQMNVMDITLRWDLTGPGVINATSTTLVGGLFDNTSPPPGCTFPLIQGPDLNIPPGFLRVRAVMACGSNPYPTGNGILLKVNFIVLQVGATSIDIVQTESSGKRRTTIGFGSTNIPYEVDNAYFRNKAGIPPVAQFTISPSAPTVGSSVHVDASSSFDPDNQTGATNGIGRYTWVWGDGTQNQEGSSQNHVYITQPNIPLSGNFSTYLIVWDVDDQLPNREIIVVQIGAGVIHDVSVSLSSDKIEVNQGGEVGLTLTVSNQGNQNEFVSFNVTINDPQSPLIGSENNVSLPHIGTGPTRQYTVPTSNLTPRAYTVTANVWIVNSTGIVPDSKPDNNHNSVSFTVLPPGGNSSFLTLPLLAGIGVAVVAAVIIVSRVLRSRRKEE